MGQTPSSVWLRLKMSYTGDDWIFFENAYLSYDGITREFPFNKYKDKESDNSGGDVWEWIDLSVSSDDAVIVPGTTPTLTFSIDSDVMSEQITE
jgi:hypothetical protein